MGRVRTLARRVITDESGEAHEELIPKWRHLNVFEGEQVQRGEVIADGEPNPHDILRLQGVAHLADYLVREIQDEVLGLGPLEPLLQDPAVADILVNGHKDVYIERYGKIERTPVRFKDDTHLMRIIRGGLSLLKLELIRAGSRRL